MSDFTRIVKTGKILKISCVRFHFVKFDIYFLGLPWEIVFGFTITMVITMVPITMVIKWYCNGIVMVLVL